MLGRATEEWRAVSRTRGQIESQVAVFINGFEREHMGRGASEIRAFLVEDMLLIRLRGILTPAEQQLAKAESNERGRELIKQVRLELLNRAQSTLAAGIRAITGVAVRSMHVDISTRTGEKVIVFSLVDPPAVTD
jgi:uncharacterized protein YbcI